MGEWGWVGGCVGEWISGGGCEMVWVVGWLGGWVGRVGVGGCCSTPLAHLPRCVSRTCGSWRQRNPQPHPGCNLSVPPPTLSRCAGELSPPLTPTSYR